MPNMSSPDHRYHKHMACLMKSCCWTVSLAAAVELGSFAVSSFVANVKMAKIENLNIFVSLFYFNVNDKCECFSFSLTTTTQKNARLGGEIQV